MPTTDIHDNRYDYDPWRSHDDYSRHAIVDPGSHILFDPIANYDTADDHRASLGGLISSPSVPTGHPHRGNAYLYRMT